MCSCIITDNHFLKDNLLCLVSNAVKYADSGATIDVRISVVFASSPQLSQRSQQSMVMVMVEDTGIGISDDLKEVLFKPFQQAQRSAGGTGLGLFSLAGRIQSLEGMCGVRNRDDDKQGSVFWFTFPYRPDEICVSVCGPVDGTGVPVPMPQVADAAPWLPPLRILLTDDAASILKVTKRFLEKNGHTVETAENGNQSLERLKARRDDFDLLITDLQMPVMDGFESVKRFREREAALNILTYDHISAGTDTDAGSATVRPTSLKSLRLFIVGMSAKADEQTKCDVFSVGMDAFVPKPFDYKTLVDELKGSPIFTEMMHRRDMVAKSN